MSLHSHENIVVVGDTVFVMQLMHKRLTCILINYMRDLFLFLIVKNQICCYDVVGRPVVGYR